MWQNQVRSADLLQRLLMVNIALFILLHLVHSLSALFLHPMLDFATASRWLAVPAALPVLVVKPWSLLTYQFFHWDFFHLLFNMLWLYWMGKIFQEYLGRSEIVRNLFARRIERSRLYHRFYNVFPLFADGVRDSFALGASASVLAVTIATATLARIIRSNCCCSARYASSGSRSSLFYWTSSTFPVPMPAVTSPTWEARSSVHLYPAITVGP